jgi:hypothetical protein
MTPKEERDRLSALRALDRLRNGGTITRKRPRSRVHLRACQKAHYKAPGKAQ